MTATAKPTRLNPQPSRTWTGTTRPMTTTDRGTSSVTSSVPDELAYTGVGEALAVIALIGLALIGVGVASNLHHRRSNH